MRNKQFLMILVILFVSVIVVTACAGVPTDEGVTPGPDSGGFNENMDEEDAYPEPEESEPKDAYPEPAETVERNELGYPLPVEPGGGRIEPYPTQEHQYAPQDGDSDMVRGVSYIDVVTVDLLESDPVQVNLNLIGNLPTPCHEIRVIVYDVEEDGTIPVRVYTLQDPDAMCIQVLEPFEISLSLGEFTDGDYSVVINGEQAVDFRID